LKQQLDNPIYLSDIKNKDAFKTISRQQLVQKDTGPKMSDDADKSELYKTDTERGMENLRKQLENPRKIDLSQFDKKKHQQELDQLRQKIGNEGERMNFGDFNRKLTEPEQPELYKTDTERGMENLRKQLENPRKIDLDKIPRR
jgi:phage FluMu protein gp41